MPNTGMGNYYIQYINLAIVSIHTPTHRHFNLILGEYALYIQQKDFTQQRKKEIERERVALIISSGKNYILCPFVNMVREYENIRLDDDEDERKIRYQFRFDGKFKGKCKTKIL